MSLPTLTAALITLNEERNLPALLPRLDWADEIVVVDGGSRDNTVNLARRHGCRVAMVSGSDARLAALARAGITGIDRRRFPDINFDEKRHAADPAYRRSFQESERALLEVVNDATQGRGVAIFISANAQATLRTPKCSMIAEAS